jgi:hypothetical protein
MRLAFRDSSHRTTPVGSETGTLDLSALHLEGPTGEDILPSFDTGIATIPNLLPEETFSLIRQSVPLDTTDGSLWSLKAQPT